MSKYNIGDEVWTLYNNQGRVGWVFSKGYIIGKVEGERPYLVSAKTSAKEYVVQTSQYSSDDFEEWQLFESQENLIKHLADNAVTAPRDIKE